MKIKFILVIFVLFSSKIYSQTGICFTGGIGINSSVTIYPLANENIKLDLGVKPGFSYFFGPVVFYPINEKNKISFSALFFNKSYQQNDFHLNFYYLSAPLKWKHLWFNKIGTTIGIEGNIFLTNSFENNYGMQPYNFDFFIGIYYKINNKIDISVNYHRDLTPFNSITLFETQKAYNYCTFISVEYNITGK